MTLYIILFILVLMMGAFINGAAMLNTVLSHWHHRFGSPPFSPQDFYKTVEETMIKKGITKVTYSRISYSQGGLLSPNREYLRIAYKELIFDICAAPFANDFFVSWWLGETGNPVRDFFRNLPLLGKLFKKREKTFFELDTEIMFKDAVSSCVKESIELLSEAKGLRKLSQEEWTPNNALYN